MDLWTAPELGGSPGDFQTEPGRPGHQGVELEVRKQSGKQGGSLSHLPGRSASMCCGCPGFIKDVIQRKESIAKIRGLQTHSVAHSPPLQVFN